MSFAEAAYSWFATNLGTIADLIIVGGAIIGTATYVHRRYFLRPEIVVTHPDTGPPEFGRLLGIWWRFKNISKVRCDLFSLGVVVRPGTFGVQFVSDATLDKGSEVVVGYSLKENDGRGPAQYAGAVRLYPFTEGPQRTFVRDGIDLLLDWNKTYTFEFRFHWAGSGLHSKSWEVDTGSPAAAFPKNRRK